MSDQFERGQGGHSNEYGPHSVAKEQAAQWLVRLDQGALRPEEKQSLRDWLASSEIHGEYLRKYAGNWDAMGVLHELAELFPLPDSEPLLSEGGRQNTKAHWLSGVLSAPKYSSWGYAMASLAICAVLVFSLLDSPAPTQQDFRTAVGEQRRYVLSDGSTLLLNTNSLISVDFTGPQRVLRLKHGEMNVEVAKDREHPLVVYAGGGLVRAVGTAFSVRLRAEEVDVLVTEGRVQVFANLDAEPEALVIPEARQTLLEAGQAVQYSEVMGVIESVEPKRLEKKLAWKNGGLVFRGETLEQALAEISRYTHKELVIVDSSIKHTRVGGHYKTDDIDGLMLILSRGLGLKMEVVSDKQILLSAK